MTTTNPEQTVIQVNENPPTTTPTAVDESTTTPPVPANTVIVVEPAPVEVVVIGDTTAAKPTEEAALLNELEGIEKKLNDKETQDAIKKVAIFAACCGSSIILTCFGIASIIPLLKLIIGLRYADECPINWRIPHYLVVAGACELVSIGLSILQVILGMFDVFKGDKKTPVANLVSRGIPIIIVFINLFTFGWFIAGCVWIFGAYSDVQYKHPQSSNYCRATLYRFAFWLLVLSIIFHIITCCSSFKNLYPKKSKQKAQAVPTTEQP